MEESRIRNSKTKLADGPRLREGDIESMADTVRAKTTEFGSSRLETKEAADGDEDGVETI